jgi:hypothetical protein
MFRHVLEHPLLCSLYDYWNQKRGGRAMPARRDVDPLELSPALLPHLALADLVENGAALRFRVVGTGLVARLGFDPTSRQVDARTGGGYLGALAALHSVVHAERVPVHVASTFRWGGRNRLELRHLLLPLTHGGADPAMALLAVLFSAENASVPPIRRLDEIGMHTERRRDLLVSPGSPAPVRAGAA